ncbi:MAG: ABC transporter ATP-binding protein [Phycisphaerales bacterium]
MLATTDLHFAYHPARPVLRGVTTSFTPGTFTAIVGPNGSGKSTLLRLLLGTLTPSSGAATLAGIPPGTLNPRARAARIGYIAQRADLAEAFTILQYVALGRFALSRRDAAVHSALERCALLPRASDLFGELSAGQQQRATLARVLAQLDGGDPSTQTILADEPASAMDPRHALFTLGVLKAESRRGLTIAVVLHDLTLAARLADRVLVLDEQGQLAADGPPSTALEPVLLERVFGVGFERADLPGGVSIVPTLLPPTHARPH